MQYSINRRPVENETGCSSLITWRRVPNAKIFFMKMITDSVLRLIHIRMNKTIEQVKYF